MVEVNLTKEVQGQIGLLATNDNRTNRPWDSYRHEPAPVYYQENGLVSSLTHNSSTNGVHNVYSLQAINSNGVAPTGPGVPSIVMLYPYDHNVGCGSSTEQVEIGSFGPVHFPGINEIPQCDDDSPGRGMHEQQKFREGSALSSLDQPSSALFFYRLK